MNKYRYDIKEELSKLDSISNLASFIEIPINIYNSFTATEAVVFKTYILYQKQGYQPKVESISELTGITRKTVIKAKERFKENGLFNQKGTIRRIKDAHFQSVPKYLYQYFLNPSESAVLDIILFKFSVKKQVITVRDIQDNIRLSETQLKRILRKFRINGLIHKGKGICPNMEEIIKANTYMGSVLSKKKQIASNKEDLIKYIKQPICMKTEETTKDTSINSVLTPYESKALQAIMDGKTTRKDISNKAKFSEDVCKGLVKLLLKYDIIKQDKKKITPNFERINEIEKEMQMIPIEERTEEIAKIRGLLIKQPSKKVFYEY